MPECPDVGMSLKFPSKNPRKTFAIHFFIDYFQPCALIFSNFFLFTTLVLKMRHPSWMSQVITQGNTFNSHFKEKRRCISGIMPPLAVLRNATTRLGGSILYKLYPSFEGYNIPYSHYWIPGNTAANCSSVDCSILYRHLKYFWLWEII